ncbi:MAG: hypothetical protein IK136_02475 [Oscillospiraceae bacterium]|nr:hypothetical protein [Oscillospiraceae bacterium]
MKRFGRIIGLLLAASMLLTLAACGENEKEKIAKLAYTWETMEYVEPDEAKDILEYFGFEEEELAYADLETMGFVRLMTLTADKTYVQEYDVQKTCDYFRQYFDSYIETLYTHAAELTDVYSESIVEVEDADEFRQFYAWLFDYDEYDEYLDDVVDEFVEIFELNDNLIERGTYELDKEKLKLKEEGSDTAEYVVYSVDDSTLTIEYSNDTEHYTRLG